MCAGRMEDSADIGPAYVASWRAGYEGLLPADVLDTEADKRAAYDWAGAIRRESSFVRVAAANRVIGVVEASDPPGGSRDLPEITMLYVIPE